RQGNAAYGQQGCDEVSRTGRARADVSQGEIHSHQFGGINRAVGRNATFDGKGGARRTDSRQAIIVGNRPDGLAVVDVRVDWAVQVHEKGFIRFIDRVADDLNRNS